jgi:hypothetical protein
LSRVGNVGVVMRLFAVIAQPLSVDAGLEGN